MDDKALQGELDITCRVYACVGKAVQEAFERFHDINPKSEAAVEFFKGWVIGRAEQLRQERRDNADQD